MNLLEMSSRDCSLKDYLTSKEVNKIILKKNILIGLIIFATLAFYAWAISIIIINAAVWSTPMAVVFGSSCGSFGALPAFVIGGRIHKNASKKIAELLKDFGHDLDGLAQTDNIHE